MSFPQLDKELQEAVETIHDIADVPLDVTEYLEEKTPSGEQMAENGYQDKSQKLYKSLDEKFDLRSVGKSEEFYFDSTGENVTHIARSSGNVYVISFYMSYEKDYRGRIKQDRFGNDIKKATSHYVTEA